MNGKKTEWDVTSVSCYQMAWKSLCHDMLAYTDSFWYSDKANTQHFHIWNRKIQSYKLNNEAEIRPNTTLHLQQLLGVLPTELSLIPFTQEK